MAKILVFGSYKIVGIPSEVERWLEEYTRQGHEFIVGGSSTLDNALHRTLSGVGAADKTTVYCMGYARYSLTSRLGSLIQYMMQKRSRQ